MIIWKVVHMVSAAKGAENFYTIEEHTTRSGDNLRINFSGRGFPYIFFKVRSITEMYLLLQNFQTFKNQTVKKII